MKMIAVYSVFRVKRPCFVLNGALTLIRRSGHNGTTIYLMPNKTMIKTESFPCYIMGLYGFRTQALLAKWLFTNEENGVQQYYSVFQIHPSLIKRCAFLFCCIIGLCAFRAHILLITHRFLIKQIFITGLQHQ